MQTQSPLRWLYTALLISACAPLLLVLLIPGAALLQRFSFDLFLQQLQDKNTLDAIRLSAITSTFSTVLVMIAGTPIAYVLARRQGSRSIRILETIVDLPMVFPPAVAGVALLLAFGRKGLIGGWLADLGIEIVFTPVAVVIAQIFVAGPFYIRTAAVGLAVVPRETLEAATLDGADWLAQLWHVTLPLAWRAIVSGAVLCWARAVGEFGATMIFAGNMPGRTQTMTLAVYIGFETDLDQALVLAVILLTLSFLVLLLTRTWLARMDKN